MGKHVPKNPLSDATANSIFTSAPFRTRELCLPTGLCNNHSQSLTCTVRVLVRILVLLATTLCAHAQSSVWWYPLGPMGATRYQSAPTADTSTPVIRWRSTALRSSPLALVGALRPDSLGAQQIVGQIGNEIRVLKSEGFLDTALPIASLFLGAPDASILLTGLFDGSAPTPAASGKPNTLGVGVTQTQSSPTVPPYGLLLDPMLRRKRELWIERLNAASGPNAIASVYPIAHYTPPGQPGPVAYALVSQNAYVGCAGCDTMVNGLRYYRLDSAKLSASPSWSYIVAPRTYAQPPALAVDADDQPTLLVAMTHSSYTFLPPVLARQTAQNRTLETSSAQIYMYLLRGSAVIDEPAEAVSMRIEGETQGESHSYVVSLKRNETSPEQTFRVVTENHDAARPGTARLYLRSYNQSLQLGLYEDSAAFRNLGWSIVQADLDGRDRSIGRDHIRPSPGREIIGMRRRLDGEPLDSNRIYAFRYGTVLQLYADQAFNGELLAAGDIVADSLGKDEIVCANGSTLTILRFRRFDEGETFLFPPNYFDTVGVYSLDGRVTYAAIADVDGDGSNDLVVVTANSTYLIGRSHPAPFGSLRADRTIICSRDSLVLSWQRAVAGGESGIRIELEDIDAQTIKPIEDAFVSDARQRYVFRATGLKPGRYRFRLSEVGIPSIVGIGAEFEVGEPSIQPFSAPSADAYTPVSIAVIAPCVDSLVLEYSFDNNNWTGISNPFDVRGGQTSIEFPMPCPADRNCASSSEQTIFFRFRTSDGALISQVRPGRVTVAPTTISNAPVSGGSPRRRMLSWEPDAFACDTVAVSLSVDNGLTWADVADVATAAGSIEVDVAGELEQDVVALVCCTSGCGSGRTTFTVSEIEEANFIAPNPFDPTKETNATVIYRLPRAGDVTIALYDVSRALVRTIVAGEALDAGLHRARWDGRNTEGDIVADGTYICVIASSSGDRITLPLSVAKR